MSSIIVFNNFKLPFIVFIDYRINIKIIRGPGELTADNSPEMPLVKDGSECEIRMSDLKAEMLGLDFFMCPECRRLRHQMRRVFTAKDRH